MSTMTHFPTMTQGREHLKEVFDAAVEGRPASVTRERHRIAAMDAEKFVSFVRAVSPANAQLISENGGWSLFFPALPVVSAGATPDEAVEDAVDALRDYAEAWSDRLRTAPNHSRNWGLVQLIELSDDDQLKSWIQGE